METALGRLPRRVPLAYLPHLGVKPLEVSRALREELVKRIGTDGSEVELRTKSRVRPSRYLMCDSVACTLLWTWENDEGEGGQEGGGSLLTQVRG